MIDGTVKSKEFTQIRFLNRISVFEGVYAC
jgi:hypothetical protein